MQIVDPGDIGDRGNGSVDFMPVQVGRDLFEEDAEGGSKDGTRAGHHDDAEDDSADGINDGPGGTKVDYDSSDENCDGLE